MTQRKFLIRYNSGRQVVTCATKTEANRLARQAAKMLGWVSWTVEPFMGAA